MSDLISKLADDLVALNNASPRLPSKEQIEEVLRATLNIPIDTAQSKFGSASALFDGTGDWLTEFRISGEEPMYVKWSQPELCPPKPYLATQEQLVKAADAICASEQHKSGYTPCPNDGNGLHVWDTSWLGFRCCNCDYGHKP